MHKLLSAFLISGAVLTVMAGCLTAHAQAAPTLQSEQAAADRLIKNTEATITPAEKTAAKDSTVYSVKGTEGTGIGSALFGWVNLKVLNYGLFYLNIVAGMIGSQLFVLASMLVEFGLYLNGTILNSEVVQLGWRVTRDLANLGFTIGIVVIAYATMLGYENYGIKKTLLNFIIAAVMVNFSFAGAGFVIDGSNMVTHFFVTKSAGTGANDDASVAHRFATSLATAFGPQRLLQTDPNDEKAFQEAATAGGFTELVLSTFFIAIFTIFAACGMLAVGLTTFKRFFELASLIVVMPGAILCSAFPATKKHWGKWQAKFWEQIFYLPVATFGIYLALMFVEIKAQAGLNAGNLANALGATNAKDFNGALPSIPWAFSIMVDMSITLGLMYTAIIQASKMGGAGGKIAVDWAKDTKEWVTGGMGKPSAQSYAARKLLSVGPSKDSNLSTLIGSGLARIPILRRLGPSITNFTSNATEKAVKGHEDAYKSMNKDQLLANARSVEIGTNAERMAAMAKVIASKGYFSTDGGSKGLTDAEFAEFVPAAKRFGIDKEILKTSPHLFREFGKSEADLDKFMAKEFKGEDMDKINPASLLDASVVRNLKNIHLKKLEDGSKKDHRANLIGTLKKMRDADEKSGTETFADFMKENFKGAKDIDGIHPEFFKADEDGDIGADFIANLNEGHIRQIEKESGDFGQGEAVLHAMTAAYAKASGDAEKTVKLDTFAKRIVDGGKDAILWTGLAQAAETRAAFEAVREEYEKRQIQTFGIEHVVEKPKAAKGGGSVEREIAALEGAKTLTREQEEALARMKEARGNDEERGGGPAAAQAPAPKPKPVTPAGGGAPIPQAAQAPQQPTPIDPTQLAVNALKNRAPVAGSADAVLRETEPLQTFGMEEFVKIEPGSEQETKKPEQEKKTNTL